MTTLTDRYVHAATRRLGDDQREDVALELRASIEDEIDAVTSDGLPRADAERRVLAEFGDPDRLSAQYTGAVQHLVGPELYPTYLRVLRAVLATVVPIAVIVIAAIDLIEDEPLRDVFGHAVAMTLTLVVQICFWTTVAFALTERSNEPDARKSLGLDAWTPDDLPDLPHASRASLGETITNIVFLGVLAGLIAWQQLSSPVTAEGERIPILDPDLWSFWLPVILATLALEAAFEVVKYRAGGAWSVRFAALNTVTGAIFAAPVIWLASQDRLLNPDLVEYLQSQWADFDPGVAHTVIILSAAAIWAMDTFDGWRKAVRS